ncbi:hypothetical protein F5882DRAFT_126528 [Hyaloscypha sp. PMI_1271]|nr:hypothetical protein F5882DRAFT_126528 [Hyaloscypha sp. PMI_1271]
MLNVLFWEYCPQKACFCSKPFSYMSYFLQTIFSQDTLPFWQIVVGKNGQLMARAVGSGDRTLHISFDQSLNRDSSREASLSYRLPVLTADHFISTIRSLLNRAAALSLCLLKRLTIHPWFCSSTSQEPSDVPMLILDGQSHRGLSFPFGMFFDAGTAIQEDSHRLQVAIVSCCLQSRTAIGVNRVHRGTEFQESSHHIMMAVLNSQDKWRAESTAAINFCPPCSQ